MKINEFLNLVPILRFKGDPQGEPWRFYIPLMDFIEVLEKNGLEIMSENEKFWKNAVESARSLSEKARNDGKQE